MEFSLSEIPSGLIAGIVFLLALSAFCSGLEMALASVNRLRIKTKSENGDTKAQKIYELIEDYDHSATTIIVLNNIVNILLATVSTTFFMTLFKGNEAMASAISTITMTILILIFGEIFPKIYGKENSESLLNATVNGLIFLRTLLFPIVYLFIKLNNAIKKLYAKNHEKEEEQIEVEDEILTLLQESSEEGNINEDDEELIRNAVEFNDIRVSEILQSKDNIIAIDVEMPTSEIIDILRQEKYSRIPVYEENSDNFIGVLNERDFYENYIQDQNFNIREILNEPMFIPDTLKISKLLIRLQQDHKHMTFVVDERGTIQGLVTIEDIIEELVGEIWDEHDEIVTEYETISDGKYEVIAEFSIADFNKLFDVDDIEPETDETTIAGYILELAEKIPEIDEVYEDDNFIYTISEVSGKRIEKIIVELKK